MDGVVSKIYVFDEQLVISWLKMYIVASSHEMNAMQLKSSAKLRISKDESQLKENDYFFLYGTYMGFPYSQQLQSTIFQFYSFSTGNYFMLMQSHTINQKSPIKVTAATIPNVIILIILMILASLVSISRLFNMKTVRGI